MVLIVGYASLVNLAHQQTGKTQSAVSTVRAARLAGPVGQSMRRSDYALPSGRYQGT
jgi:hypothetical protein